MAVAVWVSAYLYNNLFLFFWPATGAGRGQAWCAGQGWGHTASRGTASPHTVPIATTPRYARRQQSRALGTLQEHSTYTPIINLTIITVFYLGQGSLRYNKASQHEGVHT